MNYTYDDCIERVLNRDYKLELFMIAYMCELEEKLNNNLKYFDDVVFHLDEANSDQEIKKRIRQFIIENIKNVKYIKEVYLENDECKSIDNKYYIESIKLPSELSEMEKSYLKSNKKAVYTNPDLLFFVSNGKDTTPISIEIKSTLNNKIPGSSIQQISEDDWVIFIKHTKERVTEFITGRYIDSISGTMQFPDRSPRPQVAFNNLKEWNNNHRYKVNSKLVIKSDESKKDKLALLSDWQMVLSTRWLEVLKHDKKMNNEPWFNNNIRKFSIMLLDYYDSLDIDDREKMKNKIIKNIEEGNKDE